MIIWIASYPKSGNTWLRALISTYFFSKDGTFNDDLLKNIDQFPTSQYFKNFNHDIYSIYGAGKGGRTLDLLVGNETLYH